MYVTDPSPLSTAAPWAGVVTDWTASSEPWSLAVGAVAPVRVTGVFTAVAVVSFTASGVTVMVAVAEAVAPFTSAIV